jgi:CMP-N,N'-diacetyllegionaminic acid synthase
MTAARPSAVAFVPARAGSKRLVHKNIRPLRGHPLMAYTICAARASRVFDAVVVATDSELYADIARHYGAETPFLRSPEISGGDSPDIDWIEFTLDRLELQGRRFDVFSILRPTSPFRKPETIRRAWDRFVAASGVDSLRAVEKVEQHPGKMWVIRGNRLLPLLPLTPTEAPWHSQQYAALPEVYVQNASLELAWTRVVREGRTIAGSTLLPFITQGDEGLDINRSEDWWYCSHLLDRGEARLPDIDVAPYPAERLPVRSDQNLS